MLFKNMLISENSEINKYICFKEYERNYFSNNFEECKRFLKK